MTEPGEKLSDEEYKEQLQRGLARSEKIVADLRFDLLLSSMLTQTSVDVMRSKIIGEEDNIARTKAQLKRMP